MLAPESSAWVRAWVATSGKESSSEGTEGTREAAAGDEAEAAWVWGRDKGARRGWTETREHAGGSWCSCEVVAVLVAESSAWEMAWEASANTREQAGGSWCSCVDVAVVGGALESPTARL